jgi:hypothetical protein
MQPLIWLRNYPKRWERTYWLRTPLTLPKGSAIRVDASEPAASAVLLMGK